jgi:hypothetical protein
MDGILSITSYDGDNYGGGMITSSTGLEVSDGLSAHFRNDT